MKIINAQSPALFELASEKLGGFYRHEKGDKVLTASSEGRILGQAVFSDITIGVKTEISVWFDRNRGLAGRAFLKAMFQVAFREWHCIRVSAVTRESNVAAQRALVAMGFVFEAPLVAWFGNEPGWMFRMLRDDCAWLK